MTAIRRRTAWGAIAVLLAASVAHADQTPLPAPNAASGKTLFVKHTCSFCHGTVGQGAGPTGARIGPPSRALAGFIAYVREPAGAMPAFGEKILSQADLADMYAYLRSIPAPTAAKEIPLLQTLVPRR
jgi:mono/diheme cytochrome c family protein